MIGSYFKTSFRYLRKHPLFAFINLAGMAIALCAVYFAWLYVDFERHYDTENPNRDRIVRISTDVTTPSGINFETSPGPLAAALKQEIPEVENVTRIFIDYYIVQKGNDAAREEILAYADSSIFSVLQFPLVAGTPGSVFQTPYSLVLSESAARRYFGNTSCLGKSLMLDGSITATVSGIMKDIPLNSHFRTDMLLSMQSLENGTNRSANWKHFGYATYVLLKAGTDRELFNRKLQTLAKKLPDQSNQFSYRFVAEPLATLYLGGSHRGNKAGATLHGNKNNMLIILAVGFFILLIACFNFMNLSTALSINRAREIGVRKVTGARRWQLIVQFMTDSLVLSVLAFIGALLLCLLLTPLFNQFAGKEIIRPNMPYGYLLIFFALSIVAGLFAGVYPAFFMSGYRVIGTLKGAFSRTGNMLRFRKVLVITQFTISMLLITGTVVVYRQVNFMKNDRLGFSKAHNLVIDYHYDSRITGHPDRVRAQLGSIPGIESISWSSCIPGRPNKTFATTFEDSNFHSVDIQSDAWFVDPQFLDQYGIRLVAGRNFSNDFATDLRHSMIINETAARKLGYTDVAKAIGTTWSQRGNSGRIIGVVQDFYYHSAHTSMQPLTLMQSPGFYTFITLSIQSDQLARRIDQLKAKWESLAPGLPFIYYFTDETYNAQYRDEERFGRLFTCLSALAVIISCLGLFGLTLFNIAQRRKEIGIRKVLGASLSELARLLTGEFAVLSLIALSLCLPVSWLLANYWLENFSHRIMFSPLLPIAAGIITWLIGLASISGLLFRAASENPVVSLRTE